MKLLSGSVFTDHPRSSSWYRLQTMYLKRTVANCDHVVFLNGSCDQYGASVIGTNLHREENQSLDHINGLNKLLSYFRDRIDEYDYFLFIDSDCFPFRNNWMRSLADKISEHQIAAVVRFENLDSFPHPSVVFLSRDGLEKVEFEFKTNKNLLGEEFTDAIVKADKYFPLIRTNIKNLHPILFGIYWETFYHHGAGSRETKVRAVESKYYNNYKSNNICHLENGIYQKIINDTDVILTDLSGHVNIKMI